MKGSGVAGETCACGLAGRRYNTLAVSVSALFHFDFDVFRNFAPPFSVEQVGMEAPACFPTNENVFALLRVARIIFESQMANDGAP